jgi:hypothetical protein
VAGKPIIARFDGGALSSDGGLLALRDIEKRLGIAKRFAGCIDDPRAPERIQHSLADMLRFRLLMIAARYEDDNDAYSLRHDLPFKLANGRLPDAAALCSQPTLSRLENTPGPRELIRMARAVVALYCAAFHYVPRRITPDIYDTFIRCMARRSSASSMPTMPNTASSRSPSSTPRAHLSPPCCAPPGVLPEPRRALSCVA